MQWLSYLLPIAFSCAFTSINTIRSIDGGSSIVAKIILSIFCKRHYSECKFQFYWNKTMFKEMFTFTGWNIYGSGVWMINEQGINIY